MGRDHTTTLRRQDVGAVKTKSFLEEGVVRRTKSLANDILGRRKIS